MPGTRPDRFEIVVRSVYGILVGAIVGFCLSVQLHVSSLVILGITIIFSAVFAA
jgi:hypothetical protein